jgi:hypothetical protein
LHQLLPSAANSFVWALLIDHSAKPQGKTFAQQSYYGTFMMDSSSLRVWILLHSVQLVESVSDLA